MWLIDCFKAVVNDKGFDVPSEQAQSAKDTAAKVIAASESAESQLKLSEFAEQLFVLLGPVFASKPNKSLKLQCEQMWSAYHSLRTSHEFVQILQMDI